MYLRELKAGIKSLLIWTAVVAVLIIVALGKFAAFSGNPESLAILDTMPPQLLDALSMRAFNLTTVDGFFGVMFVYFSLMAAMAAALWGSEAIAKEERDRTVEFSLVLPVTRKHHKNSCSPDQLRPVCAFHLDRFSCCCAHLFAWKRLL